MRIALQTLVVLSTAFLSAALYQHDRASYAATAWEAPSQGRAR